MSARVAIDIPPDVLDVLRHGIAIDGCHVRITRQLDRDLYQRVDRILQACGGRWNRKARAHVFDADPTERLQGGAEHGTVERLKVKYQFYETPPGLAAEMVDYLRLRPAERVLEPSAGRGALVRPCLRVGAHVTAIELWDENIPHLRCVLPEDEIARGDFLFMQSVGRLYDAAVMNPPFTNGQAIRHIRHAWHWLKPNGRMVALCDPGALTNGNAAARDFVAWLDSVCAEVRDVPPGTFEDTKIAAKLLIIWKGRSA